MAQLWKIRLPSGKVLQPSDWTAAEPLYSTVEIGDGTFPVLSAFSYPLGGEIPGSATNRRATIADTNLEGEGARLPENEELIAYGLAIEAFMIGQEDTQSPDTIPGNDPPNVSLLNMLRLQRDLLVVTRVAYVKEYTRAPLEAFPASTGVAQYNSGGRSNVSTGANGFVSANNGGDRVCDMREFASPLYIAGGEAISVDFRPGPGSVTGLNLATGSRIRLRAFFEGYRRRPVA